MKHFFSRKTLFALLFIFGLFLTPFSADISLISETDSGTKFALQADLVVHSAEAFVAQTCNGVEDVGCHILNGILTFYEVVFYSSTQVGAVVVGIMMDAVMSFSISSSFYRTSGIIEVGWEIVRDVVNIVFIFVLLIIAFKMVLGSNDTNNKRNLVRTILVALVINFSLFMSYAIIDGSNILAHVFWNRINVDASLYHQQTSNEHGINIATWVESLGIKRSPSLAIAGQINPQQMINSINANSGGATWYVAVILLTGCIILNLVLIWMFFNVMLMFFGRILGLIILVVLSPIAFASIVVPGLKKTKWIGWEDWFPNLLKLSFMAPIFLFFLWLTTNFVGNQGLLATLRPDVNPTGSGNWLLTIINTYLILGLIAGMLYLTKKVTQDVSGKFGSMASDLVTKAIGGTIAVAGIAATGGAAALGGAARLGGALTGGKKTAVGRTLSNAGKRAMAFKADPTKLPGFSKLMGKEATGMISKVTGKSVREREQQLTLGAMKTWEGTKDMVKGRSFKEGEFEFEKAKREIRDNSGKWQEKITDAESATRIEDARSKLIDRDSFEDPTKTNKKFIQELQDAFSKGTVVEVNATGGPVAAVLDPAITSIIQEIDPATGMPLPIHVSKDGKSTSAPVSQVEFQEIVLKKIDSANKEIDKDIRSKSQEIKVAERELAKANASGDTTAISTAESTLRRLERDKLDLENKKDDNQKQKEIYEQKSLKKGKEKADQLETSITGMAREKIAGEREAESDQKAADRIRSGKVKIDTKKDDDK